MKRYGGLIISVVLAQVLLSVPLANAAGCANTSSYGAVNLSVPTLPDLDSYALWVRMQGPNASSKLLIEANQTDCFEINANNLAPNQWSWQVFSENGKTASLKFAEAKNNSLRLIGIEAGVKVDRVLLTKPDCIPVEFGDNCQDAVKLENYSEMDGVEMLPPPSNDTVSGKVILSSTPERHEPRLKTVSYAISGRTLQSSTTPEPFDTTLTTNGKHTVLITTTLTEGEPIKESTVIDVKNSENPLTPVVRWVRLNQDSLKAGSLIAGAVLFCGTAYWFIKRSLRARRERTFHGF